MNGYENGSSIDYHRVASKDINDTMNEIKSRWQTLDEEERIRFLTTPLEVLFGTHNLQTVMKPISDYSVGKVWVTTNRQPPIFFWVAGTTAHTITFLTIARQSERVGEENGKGKYLHTPLFEFDHLIKGPYKVNERLLFIRL